MHQDWFGLEEFKIGEDCQHVWRIGNYWCEDMFYEDLSIKIVDCLAFISINWSIHMVHSLIKIGDSYQSLFIMEWRR